MAETENTMELLQHIDRQYISTIAMFRNASQGSPEKSVVRDIYNLFKTTLNRMHRLNPTWKTMNHGSFGFDDNGMGNLRVVLGTDVTGLLTGDSDMRCLLEVENVVNDAYLDLPTIPEPVDRFLDQLENYANSYPDDLLIASNFIGHAESIGYKFRVCRTVKLIGGDQAIEMVMIKKNRGIRLMYNMSVPFKDHTQLHDHLNPTKRT